MIHSVNTFALKTNSSLTFTRVLRSGLLPHSQCHTVTNLLHLTAPSLPRKAQQCLQTATPASSFPAMYACAKSAKHNQMIHNFALTASPAPDRLSLKTSCMLLSNLRLRRNERHGNKRIKMSQNSAK